MTRSGFERGVDLRLMIRKAKNKDVVKLPANDPGEYMGPFLIDKPITLEGLGKKAPLLGQGGPAVIIRAPGVTLKNLDLADGCNIKNGIYLLSVADSNPILEGTTTHGRTETMTKEQLIDLGEFLPQQNQTFSFIEVEVKGPSRVKLGDNSSRWLRVAPETIPAAGKFLLQIYCNTKAIGADGMAVGNIEITTGSDTRLVWVTLHVLPAPPAQMMSGPICLAYGKDQRIRFDESFFIGKSKFPGVSAASALSEHQAIIRKEDGGTAWALFTPFQTAQPTTIDGQALAQGQRSLLREGSLIKAGSLELKVEKSAGAGSYSVDKTCLNLGSPGGTPPEPKFQVRYNGSGKEKAKFLSTLPWLDIQPAELEFKKGEVKEILVSLKPTASSLPPGKHTERGALLVQGKNEILCLDVVVDAKAESINPQAVPDQAPFGAVSDWSAGSLSIKVSNSGTKEWKPSIRADHDWLETDPASLVLPPGKSETLTVRLTEKVENLPSPSDQTAKVLLDGDGVSLSIPASVSLQIKKADILLETAWLDFKELDAWDSATPLSVTLRNKGTAEWTASVSSTVDWLNIMGGASVSVRPGAQKTFLVQINDKLPAGSSSVADAILLESEGKKLSVGVKAELRPPSADVDVYPHLVDFGKFGDLSKLPAQKVVIKNRGTADWSGTSKGSVAWLDCEPDEKNWKCASKSEIVLTLSVNDRIKEGKYEIPDALVFKDPKESFAVGVKGEYAPQPAPRSQPVDFGEVPGWETASHGKTGVHKDGKKDWTRVEATVNIHNDGKKDWNNIQVSSTVPWLSANQRTLIIPAGGSAELVLQLNQNLDSLPSGKHEIPDAIQLTGEGIQHCLQVNLVLPPYDLQADQREIAFTLDGSLKDLADLNTPLRISNAGRRDWAGKISAQVPWLVLQPGQATIRAGESLDLEAGVTDPVRDLGTGDQVFGNLIALENTSVSVGVRVSIKRTAAPPADMLDILPSPLDFGGIEEEQFKSPNIITLDVHGEKDWQAKFSPQDNWFRPETETVSGRAGQHQAVKIELTDQAPALSVGVHWSELHITRSDGQSQSVPVKLEKVEIPVELEIKPASLDLAWHVPDGPLPPETVRVRNTGKKAQKVSLSAAEDWLSVSPSGSVDCPISGSVDFSVGLTTQAEARKDGKYTQELTLRAGSKHRMTCPVTLSIDRSVVDLIVTPVGITFGAVEKSEQWDRHDPEKLTLRNNGDQEINLTITILKGGNWIETAGMIKIPRRSEKQLSVGLKAGSWNTLRLGQWEGVLELEGAGAPRSVLVALTLTQTAARSGERKAFATPTRESQPLKLGTRSLSFDEKDQSKWRLVPAQKVTLTNPNTVEWTGQAKSEDWLSVQPAFLSIPAGGSIELEIRLKASLFAKSSEATETYDRPEAVVLSGMGETYPIHVSIGQPAAASASVKPSRPEPARAEPPAAVFSKPAPEKGSAFTAPASDPSRSAAPVKNAADVLSVQPLTISFTQVEDFSTAAAQEFKITNHSSSPVPIEFKCANWLTLSTMNVVCPGNGAVPVTVKLRKRNAFEQGRNMSDTNGITVSAAGSSFPIPVSVEMK